MSCLGFLVHRSLILKGKVHPGHTCWAIMRTLGAPFAQISVPWPPLDHFLMVGMSDIKVFALCRMVEIKWRERDYKPVRDASLRDGGVRDTLAHCGLLKFMQIPLMRSLGLLMQTLISFWDVTKEVFLFQGQRIEITLKDVYFITGLPILGLVGDLAPILSQGETLEDLCD